MRFAEPIKKNFIIASAPDWVEDIAATNNLIVNSCETSNYIWGHGTNASVWKKSKISGDWVKVSAAGTATAIFSDNNNSLVVFYIGSNSSGKYSIDEGQTWYPIQQMPDIRQPYYIIDGWHFAAHNGIFILGEYYAHSSQSPRLFRSIDMGATWSTVYVETNIDSVNNSHVHCVGYHSGLDAFVAAFGDGPNRAILKSDPCGTAWTRLMIGRGSQPVQLIDYGHPTRILAGSDTREGLCSTDLMAETAYNVLNERLTVSEQGGDGEVWCVRKSDGIYYAFSYYECGIRPTFGGVKWPKCFVSTDGENWTTYHQMSVITDIRGIRHISGTAQGYLHVTINDVNGFYKCYRLKKPALSAPRTGVLIQSKSTICLILRKNPFLPVLKRQNIGRSKVQTQYSVFKTGAGFSDRVVLKQRNQPVHQVTF